jgi:replicative DNA helicase
MTEHFQPPHDLDAEGSVLSALMLDPERIAELEPILRPDDFYADCNRQIAKVIWELDAAGEAIDTTSVASRLKASDRLAQVGGSPYLAQLTGSTPAVAHIAAHAGVVAATARIRRVQTLCKVLAAEGYGAAQDAPEWLQSVEARVFEATDSASMAPDTISVMFDAVRAEHEALQARAKTGALPGRPTRIGALDRIIGGLVDSVPYVLAGRPGHGKTALAWQIAEGVARTAPVVFMSQEMPVAQLTQRAIAQGSGIEMDRLRNARGLSTRDWEAIANATQLISKLPIAIDDRAGHTVHGIRSAVRRCAQKLRAAGHVERLGLIVLDYLQIMGGERQRGDSRSTEVSDNMHGVTRLAKEFGCPVLVLSQLNREIEKRPDKRPKLSDLGESGAIEADAYCVMFVYREDCYREPAQHDGKAEIIVAKNRNGRMGRADLMYTKSTLFVATEVDAACDEFDRYADN